MAWPVRLGIRDHTHHCTQGSEAWVRSVAWLGRLPGYEAIAVDAEGEVFMTAGFAPTGRVPDFMTAGRTRTATTRGTPRWYKSPRTPRRGRCTRSTRATRRPARIPFPQVLVDHQQVLSRPDFFRC